MGKKVVIIGAGVVGLTLAKELASGGISTIVYDSKKDASEGAERASGILSIKGMDEAGLPYKGCIVNTLHGAIIHAGSQTLAVKSKAAMAHVIDRRKLAESCARSAEKAGAEIIFGRRIEVDEMRKIAGDSSNILVGADGAVSNVASAFGFPGIAEYALTYRAEYANANIADSGSVGLFFSDSFSNRFFGWTVPHSGSTLEVGIGTSSSSKTSGRSAFDRFIGSGMLDAQLKKSSADKGYASLIPLRCRRTTVKGNVLLVGDAAGQVKATTGGGIIFGTLCARTLSAAIISNVAKGTPLAAYEAGWRKRYGRELRIHSMLHSLYSGVGTKGIERMLRLSRMLGAGDFLGRYGDMDRPSLMLKRFFLRGFTR